VRGCIVGIWAPLTRRVRPAAVLPPDRGSAPEAIGRVIGRAGRRSARAAHIGRDGTPSSALASPADSGVGLAGAGCSGGAQPAAGGCRHDSGAGCVPAGRQSGVAGGPPAPGPSPAADEGGVGKGATGCR
jgi:hypothetical protein